MRICKITSIKPDGKPWESQYGMMYPFYVVLEDGGAGTVNSKSETPAYRQGDSVGYDVTGHTPKGVPKLKITRNPKPGEGTVWVPDTHPDLEAAKAPTERREPPPKIDYRGAQAPVKTQGNAIHGATVGGALARAVDIFLHGCPRGEPVDWRPLSVELVERITRDLVSIQQRVESGEQPPPF